MLFPTQKPSSSSSLLKFLRHQSVSGAPPPKKNPASAPVTVKILNEAGVDLVLIQPFLLHYVNHFVLILTSIFEYSFHKKRKKVCIKTRPTSASRSLKG